MTILDWGLDKRPEQSLRPLRPLLPDCLGISCLRPLEQLLEALLGSYCIYANRLVDLLGISLAYCKLTAFSPEVGFAMAGTLNFIYSVIFNLQDWVGQSAG